MGEINIKKNHNVHKQYRKMNFVNPYLSASTPFVSTWNTENLSTGSSLTKQVKLPLVITGTYNFSVEWGDGTTSTITAYNQAAVTHTYITAGTYEIKIKGTCIGWQFNNTRDKLKILSIKNWGKLRLGTEQSVFYGCSNLTLNNVTDTLDLTGTSSLMALFSGCTSLTVVAKINEWKTSGIINTSEMFRNCSNFNQILSFNTSSVTTMLAMFQGATSFNNGLASGVSGNMFVDTSNTTTLNAMFASATSFNQNIGSLDVLKVVDFSNMFFGATKFNNGGSSSINNWIFKNSGTINMTSMFQGATIFNQPVDNWNTSRVTNMTYLFSRATNFNQNIGSWDTSASTSMYGMFSCAFSTAGKFNNGGNTSISTWNTSVCTNMREMFWNQTTFNQPIGSWDTSKVTGMSNMFDTALAFNQNIGSWDISNVTNFSPNFMFAKTAANYSYANLDAIYNGWSARTVKPNIVITFNTAKYTAAGSAGRAILTGAPNLWTITDGGI